MKKLSFKILISVSHRAIFFFTLKLTIILPILILSTLLCDAQASMYKGIDLRTGKTKKVLHPSDKFLVLRLKSLS